MGNIFVVAAWIVGKGRQGRFIFVGKIFVVRPPTTKTTNVLPHENYLYTIPSREPDRDGTLLMLESTESLKRLVETCFFCHNFGSE